MFTKERLKILAIAVVALLAFAWMADWSPEEKEVWVGMWHDGRNQQAPDFTLKTLDGGEMSLSDLRGKIVVLNIWATWCAPCLEETPALVGVQETFREAGVEIVGLSIDNHPEQIPAFVNRFAVNYAIVLDDGVAADSYEGNTGVPTTYVIDREGRIRSYKPGPVTARELSARLEQLLQEEPA